MFHSSESSPRLSARSSSGLLNLQMKTGNSKAFLPIYLFFIFSYFMSSLGQVDPFALLGRKAANDSVVDSERVLFYLSCFLLLILFDLSRLSQSSVLSDVPSLTREGYKGILLLSSDWEYFSYWSVSFVVRRLDSLLIYIWNLHCFFFCDKIREGMTVFFFIFSLGFTSNQNLSTSASSRWEVVEVG